jgi:hypothetical protein
LTNGLRIELHHQGSLLVAVHAGFIDTDVPAPATNLPKDSPEWVAQQTFDAVEAGQVETLADERTGTVKAQLSRDQELIHPPIQKFWGDALKGGSWHAQQRLSIRRSGVVNSARQPTRRRTIGCVAPRLRRDARR